jgi:hypothetical protein
MTDNTSDDLLKQPEPDGGSPDEIAIEDDPVVDADAVAELEALFATPAEPAAAPVAPAPAGTELPSISEFVGDATGPPPTATEALESELRMVKRQLALLRLSPQERYPEVLKDAEIDIETAHQMLDCVIIRLKPWVEKVKVAKSLYVTLQTRGQFDQRRLDRWAEETRPQLDTTVQAEALLNNMAASLLAYGDDYVFDADSEEERHEQAREFLIKLPYPAYRLIQHALAKFDRKVNTVFSEGYLENF